MSFNLSRMILMAGLLSGIVVPGIAQSLGTGTIHDPSLNGIKAFTVSIPAGWKFEGTVVNGPECNPIPFPVFRAYAADGLTEMRLFPAFNWTFHPAIGNKTVSGCLPIQKTLTAAQFLDHYVETIPGGVHVIGPMSVAQPYKERVEKVAVGLNANARPGFHATVDTAAERIETINGTFTVEQRIRVWVECRTDSGMGKMNGGGCSAHIDVLRAPKGKLDSLVALVDSHDLTKPVSEQQWVSAMMQRQNQQNAERMRQLTQMEARGNALIRQQYEQIQATMNRNHQAFMQQQESQFHSAMNASWNAMNARSTTSSDWVDYALDQQTVSGAGGTVKVSNAYAHTWSNGQNQWFQTNDPNANPNGVIGGNWTQDTKVHGNGQSY